jgi:alpha-galactosidase
MSTWTFTGLTTEYTVTLPAHGRWLEHHSWGPIGVHHGPSPLGFDGRVQYMTAGDVAAVEYAPDGLRPFAGADLAAGSLRWQFVAEADGEFTFLDELTGLRAVLHYRFAPGTDVIERWVTLTNTGTAAVRLSSFDSAGFCVPSGRSYLAGQWAQEFCPYELDLPRGRFEIGSAEGVTGHRYSPYLAVDDRWSVQLAWSGSWHITADADPAGVTRIRAGRSVVDLIVEPGAVVTSPVAAGAYSADGADGLAQAWHRYERTLARQRTPEVIYNSWEATYFDVTAAGQLELAGVAASLGVETFVVDDGWFVGRGDDHGGLGDWTPDPAKFPGGFAAFVDDVRALGLKFGLWVEPEMVNPRSSLYEQHPDWVYQVAGRPMTTIRRQYLLDLGRAEVEQFVHRTLDTLLRDHPIDYLKWDFNRPRTEARQGTDVDGSHVTALYRILDALRRDHPHVTIEGCAAGGARVDLAMAARTDVLWPSDNTAPMDRLRVQDGFLRAHAPHLMSSWVTDAPGMFDDRPRSLDFRFVLACAGVLGIGADITRWTAAERETATTWIARYKEVRDIVTGGTVHRIGGPSRERCAVQYTLGGRVLVLAWSTGRLDGLGAVPARSVRLPLRGLRPDARYRHGDTLYSGAHLTAAGLPVRWTRDHDAELVLLLEEKA